MMSRPQLSCGKCGTTLTWGSEPLWFRCVLPAGTPHPLCNCEFNHVFLLCVSCLRDEHHTAKRTRYDAETQTLFIKDGDGLEGYEVRGPYGEEVQS
jgi:hypothetical protein